MADDKSPTTKVLDVLSANLNHLKPTLESWKSIFTAIARRHHNCSYVPKRKRPEF